MAPAKKPVARVVQEKPQITRVQDSLYNLISGLGSGKDPRMHSQYKLDVMTRNQLETAYRSDWIARHVVDAPAEDATREWREWQASQPQIEKIENLEKRLDIQRKIKRAMIKARLYGGAAILLGVRQGRAAG